MRDEAEISRGIRSREISAWHRLGPGLYRLRAFLFVALILAGGVLTLVVVNTARNLYPGTGTQYRGPRDSPVTVSVQECWQVGPISRFGFGYWRECRVVVHRRDGTEGSAVIGRSLFGQEDVGKSFEFMESCYDEARTDCAYGRQIDKLWEFYPILLAILSRGIAIVAIIWTLIYVLRSALGAPRYFSVIDRVRRRSTG